MTNPKIITLQEKKDELSKILQNYSQWSQVEIWSAGTTSIIKLQFPDYFDEFNSYCKPDWIRLPEGRLYSPNGEDLGPSSNSYSPSSRSRKIIAEKSKNTKIAQNAIRKLLKFLDILIQINSSELISNNSEDVLMILERIFSRFHRVSQQLKTRYPKRPTLEIGDEYDVQDLLHSLLHLYFDDIRPEVDIPEFAGKNSRIDFVLKKEEIMIEVKKTSEKLKDKHLGSQLIDDIPRYKQYQDASTLVFFIYDPDTLMINPQGIIDDIETQSNNDFFVKVFIYPRH